MVKSITPKPSSDSFVQFAKTVDGESALGDWQIAPKWSFSPRSNIFRDRICRADGGGEEKFNPDSSIAVRDIYHDNSKREGHLEKPV